MSLENERISDVFEAENTDHRKSILIQMTAKHPRNRIGFFIIINGTLLLMLKHNGKFFFEKKNLWRYTQFQLFTYNIFIEV